MVKGKRGELVFREIVLWITALLVLALITAGIFLFGEKGMNLIDSLKSFLRFR